MTIINKDELREELIDVYTKYVDGKDVGTQAQKIEELDTGIHVLGPGIQRALHGLTRLRTPPKITKDQAQKILEELQEE